MRSFKLHGYDLVCDLLSHARTDDVDLVSRSQVCHKCKLQIALFRVMLSVV